MTQKINKDLAVWRRKHFKELEATLKVAREIRDDSTANKRDRIEAAKLVARLLHGLQPEKVGTPASRHPSSAPVPKPPELSPEAKERLKGILSPIPTPNVN
jgi:hypothetical protein